ncbi:MAG: glycogen/starch synthase [Muribaculaceae bacterium]|nr:glycogen/starch synthase [Muribaculaceae bacterium]
MTNKRILFINQEINPYLPASPVSTLGKALPVAMQGKGFEVRTFMPKFGNVNERRNQLHEVIRLSGMNIIIDDNDHPLIIKVASLQPSRIQVYFIDNDDYFQKLDSDEDAVGSNRQDNDERAIFYARGAMETAKKLRWDPKIIHVAGWISSLVPMYIKRMYSDDTSFKGAKVVYSIVPGKVSAPIDERIFSKLKEDGFTARDLKKFQGMQLDTNLLHKMAIDFSHAIIIQDPDADPEIIEYVKASGKPYIMPDQIETNGMEAYADFFNSL